MVAVPRTSIAFRSLTPLGVVPPAEDGSDDREKEHFRQSIDAEDTLSSVVEILDEDQVPQKDSDY